MAVTIKDISLKAGVSHSTVSRALNNTGRMGEETRRKILQIAEEMNYVPNFSARSLVTDKSYNIGVFSVKEKVISSTFYEIIEGIQDVVGFNYSLVFKKLNNENELNEILKYKKYAGIIFISIIKDDIKYINRIKKEKIPFVVINRKMESNKIFNVVAEDFLGAFKATEHLIKLGHRDIAYVEGPPVNIVSTERRNGYLSALEKYNIPIRDEYVAASNGLPEGGFTSTCNLLGLNERPSAIFAYSDPVAIGVMKAVWKEGLTMPGDIAVVGFDNMVSSQYLVPALTSIDKPRADMGRSAAAMLLKVLNHEAQDRIVVLETRLIIRESCGAVATDFI
jgi:LacI family transcriptional regulator